MKTMTLQLSSSGKNDVLNGKISADLYLDARVIKNPFREPSLNGKTGDDPEVQQWLFDNANATLAAWSDLIEAGLKSWKTRNSGRSSDTFRVHFFCLAGVHRSRGSKNIIAQMWKKQLSFGDYAEATFGFPIEVKVI